MCFNFDQYYTECLINPITAVMLFMFIFVHQTIGLKRIIKHSRKKRELVVKYIVIVLVCFSLFYIHFGQLVYGGIYLISEKESDSIVIQGNIDEIKRIDKSVFPQIKTEYEYEETNGVQFTINGEKCTAMRQGEFEVGDYVVVNYLPKSGYILSIEKVDQSGGGSQSNQSKNTGDGSLS